MTENRDELADVLVIGGGTAGFGAAVTAGRQGLNVILIETSTKVGGVTAFARECLGELPIHLTK